MDIASLPTSIRIQPTSTLTISGTGPAALAPKTSSPEIMSRVGLAVGLGLFGSACGGVELTAGLLGAADPAAFAHRGTER